MNLRNVISLGALFCLGVVSENALAQTNVEKPLSASLSVGGNFSSGNLNQLQAFGGARASYSGDFLGADLFVNAFRFWLIPAGQNSWRQFGDDFTVFGYPYFYFRPKFFIHGLARYEASMLHRIDSRVLVGGGMGFSPLRSGNEKQFLRLSLGTYAEHTVFPGTDFSIDVPHQKGSRTLPRLGFLSNGRLTAANENISVRYLMFYFIDPFFPRDIRIGLDTNLDLKIWGPVSFRINTNWIYNSLVLVSVQPYDFRATFGLSWSFRG